MVESHCQMKAIGGYFELANREEKSSIPVDGVLLNTARNALEYILQTLSDIKKIYLPYYTCEAVIEPLKRLNLSYQFYHINWDFEIAETIVLEEGEYLIVNNYFGLKDAYIEKLSIQYGERLIVDNAQALFAFLSPETKACFSTRKFVGVADGGIATGVDMNNVASMMYEATENHNNHLYIRKELGAEAGFSHYQTNECKLDNQPVRRMSLSTYDILTHINYHKVIEQRKKNYTYLEKALNRSNQLNLPSCDSFNCPMVYPYLNNESKDLRQTLISQKIFVARYWPNVLEWTTNDSLEYYFANQILPLPIDQRYDEKDMQRIIDLIVGN